MKKILIIILFVALTVAVEITAHTLDLRVKGEPIENLGLLSIAVIFLFLSLLPTLRKRIKIKKQKKKLIALGFDVEKAIFYLENRGMVLRKVYSEGAAFRSTVGVITVDKNYVPVVVQPYDVLYKDFIGCKRCGAMKNEKYGFINQFGLVAIELKYDRIGYFSEGLCKVMIGRKWGFIGMDGTIVIEPKYYSAEPFEGGRSRVIEGTKTFYIDKRGYEIRSS